MDTIYAISNSTGSQNTTSPIPGLSRLDSEYMTSGGDIHGAIWSFFGVSIALATISTLIRVFTKFHYFKVRRCDDFLMMGSWAGLVCMWVFILLSIKDGAGEHIHNAKRSDVSGFLKYAFLHELFYAIVQCLLKTSICLQILHIFVPNPNFRTNRSPKFWIVIFFIVVQNCWFITFFFVSLFQCDPVRKEFDPSVPGTCIKGFNPYNVLVSTWNMMSDLSMLIFPLFCVSKLKMKLRFKIDAAGVFIVGTLAVVSSLLRLVYTIRALHNKDYTIVLTQIGLCDTGEITAGLLVGNFVPFPRFVSEMTLKFNILTGRVSSSKYVRDSTPTATTLSVGTIPIILQQNRSNPYAHRTSGNSGISDSTGISGTTMVTDSSQAQSFEELVRNSRMQRLSRTQCVQP